MNGRFCANKLHRFGLSPSFAVAAARVRFASGPTTNVARAVLGMAVRSGAPKPDISTPTALKQTLLKAQSIATLPASATGTQVMRVFEARGIREEMLSGDLAHHWISHLVPFRA
jgi:hypothetical protein